MIIPNILALDFDGVLCDGMQEYFEASRRSYMSVWPDETVPGEDLFHVFRTLRPVIMTGWEMPLLLRAIVQGRPQSAILQNWEAVCEDLVNSGPLHGNALVSLLQRTLDEVRREWIAADRHDWLERNIPYGALEEVRRLVAEPEYAVLVTTKEGEFARQILDHWGVRLADIHQHVTTHADLADVALFLAAWGYNTPEMRASVRGDGRIRLLELDQFRGGLTTWG
jgi:hypothetical protein